MAIFKRGKNYYTDFSVDGRRYRMSLETTDWREAQRRQKDKIAEAKDGRLKTGKASWARTPFTEAAARFFAQRSMEVGASTLETEQHEVKPLKAFLGRTPAGRITGDDVREYQAHRHAQGRSNRTTNHEVGLLRRILKRGKLWHRVAGDFKTLDFNKRVGKALAKWQKAKLLELAASRPDWQTARAAAILSFNTTMRSCEIKGLRWQDVNWLDRVLSVRSSKTDAGVREIPINGAAWNILRELHDRAKLLGTASDDSPVFTIAPGRAVKSWRTAWLSLTAAAGVPWFRFHDCRHHAITELAESQAPDMTIMAIAGHVDKEMLRHYSHVRKDAMRKALDALSPAPTEAPEPQPTAQLSQKPS